MRIRKKKTRKFIAANPYVSTEERKIPIFEMSHIRTWNLRVISIHHYPKLNMQLYIYIYKPNPDL